MLTRDTRHLLCCPGCRSEGLRFDSSEVKGERLESGKLTCNRCGRQYPVTGGIPDFLSHGHSHRDADRIWQKKLDRFADFRRKLYSCSYRAKRKAIARQKLYENLSFFLCPEGRVLDIGCGIGIPDLLPEHDYYGIDPLPNGIKEFRFFRGRGEDLPFKDGSFEAAMILASLEYCAEPGAVLSEACRVLKKDGVLLLLARVEFKGGKGSKAVYLCREGIKRILDLDFPGFFAGVQSRILRGKNVFFVHHFNEKELLQLVSAHFHIVAANVKNDILFLKARK